MWQSHSCLCTHNSSLLHLCPGADVQHPRAERTTRPAADAERAPDQHERPAAGEFTPSPTQSELKVESDILVWLQSYTLMKEKHSRCCSAGRAGKHANLFLNAQTNVESDCGSGCKWKERGDVNTWRHFFAVSLSFLVEEVVEVVAVLFAGWLRDVKIRTQKGTLRSLSSFDGSNQVSFYPPASVKQSHFSSSVKIHFGVKTLILSSFKKLVVTKDEHLWGKTGIIGLPEPLMPVRGFISSSVLWLSYAWASFRWTQTQKGTKPRQVDKVQSKNDFNQGNELGSKNKQRLTTENTRGVQKYQN